MSPQDDDDIAIMELHEKPRWKCGEIFTWNNTEQLAVECMLCDDKNLCSLMEFTSHMQVSHRSWKRANGDDAMEPESCKTKLTIETLETPNIEQNMSDKAESGEEKLHNIYETVAKEMVPAEEKVDAEMTIRVANMKDGGINAADKEQQVISRNRMWRLIVAEASIEEKEEVPITALLSNEMQMQKQIRVGQEPLAPFEEVLIEHNAATIEKDRALKNKETEDALKSSTSMETENLKIMRFTDLPHLDRKHSSYKMLFLIKLYKIHPRLWNPSHEEFNETDLCRESWQDIVKKFNTISKSSFKINDLKIQITTLCERYRAEKQRLTNEQSVNNNNAEETPKWPLFEALRFLDDQPDAIKSRRNVLHKQNLKIIEIYKRFPILWHTGNKHKLSPADRSDALESISEVLRRCDIHLSSKSVQRRLHALHKCYRKERLNFLQCLRENRKFRTHFKHYARMQFLQNHVAPYECSLCSRIFEKFHEFTEHMKTHDLKEAQQHNQDLSQQMELYIEETDLEGKDAEARNSNENMLTGEDQSQGKNMNQAPHANKETYSFSVLAMNPLKEQQETISMDGLEVDKFLATLLDREPLLEVATSIFCGADGTQSHEDIVQKRQNMEYTPTNAFKPLVESFDFPAEFCSAMNAIFNKPSPDIAVASTKATHTPYNEVAAYEIASTTTRLNESQKPEDPAHHISITLPQVSLSPRNHPNIQYMLNSSQEISTSPSHESNIPLILNYSQQTSDAQQHDSNNQFFFNSIQQTSNSTSVNMYNKNNLQSPLQISKLPDQTFNDHHILNSVQENLNSPRKTTLHILNYTQQISNSSQNLNLPMQILNTQPLVAYTQQAENSPAHGSNTLHNLNSTPQIANSPPHIFNTSHILNSVEETLKTPQTILNSQPILNSMQENLNSSQQTINAHHVLNYKQQTSKQEQILRAQHILNSIDEKSNSPQSVLNTQHGLITEIDHFNSNRIILNTQSIVNISEPTLSSSGHSNSSQQIFNSPQHVNNEHTLNPTEQTSSLLFNVLSPQHIKCSQQMLNAPHNVMNTLKQNLSSPGKILNTTQQTSYSPQHLHVSLLPTNCPTNGLDNTEYSINSSDNNTADNLSDVLNIPYIYFNADQTNSINTQQYSMDSLIISPNDNTICQIILSAEDIQTNAEYFPHNTVIIPREPINIIQTISVPKLTMNISQNVLNMQQNSKNIPSNSFNNLNIAHNVPSQNFKFSQDNPSIFHMAASDQKMSQVLMNDSCNCINSAKNNTQMCISSQSDVSSFTGNGSTDAATITVQNEVNSINNDLFINQMDLHNGAPIEPSTSETTTSNKQKRNGNFKLNFKNLSSKLKKTRTHPINNSEEDTLDGSSQDSGMHCELLFTDNFNNDSSDCISLHPATNSTRLTGEQTHKLIAIYREQTSLWDPYHKNFSCRNSRRIAWKSITVAFNKLYKLRLQWQTIYKKLTDFVKYYRKEKERVTNEDANSKWYYFHDFKFLNEYLDITSDTHKTTQEKELNLKIIKIYKTYPQLWNTHMQEYKRRSQRSRHIEAMHTSLQEEANIQITLEKLKRKLLEFRCSYRQEKEKRIECAKNNEAFESFYEYYNQLDFLEAHISPFICKVCGESFTKLTEILRHYRATKHQKISKKRIHLRSNPNPENEIRNVCHICGAKFTMRNNLIYHLNRHLGKRTHMCKMCPKSFYNSTALRVHERSHTKEYPYVCEECGQAFVNNSKLNQHRKRHSNQRDFVCNECGKAFFTAFERDKHAKRHLKIRDQICPICGKTFVLGSSIYTHMELHSEVKKYVCKICDKRFSQNSGLYRHKKIHQKKNERT